MPRVALRTWLNFIGRSTVNGDDLFQVFNIAPAVTVTIAGLNIVNGSNPNGGGISNSGTLVVSYCTLIANSAGGQGKGNGIGGGIFNLGTLTVIQSTLIDNSAKSEQRGSPQAMGGGIFNGIGSTLTIIQSTLPENSAIAQNGTVTLALAYGGGIENAGTLTIIHQRSLITARWLRGRALSGPDLAAASTTVGC